MKRKKIDFFCYFRTDDFIGAVCQSDLSNQNLIVSNNIVYRPYNI